MWNVIQVLTQGIVYSVSYNSQPTYFISRQIEDFKATLACCDSMDRFEILHNLGRLVGVTEISRDKTAQMRLLLKKNLVEEILKEEIENEVLRNQLNEINKLLNIKSKGFGCCFVGCRYEGERHREYILHIKSTHSRATNIRCNFKHTCPRSFNCIENLILHIKEDHSVTSRTNEPRFQHRDTVAVACKCNMISCGSKHFPSIKDLLTHFNTVHHGHARVCVFENCGKKFNSFSISRHHFRAQHSNQGLLKKVHLLSDIGAAQQTYQANIFTSPVDNAEIDSVNLQDYDLFDIDAIENPEHEDSEESEEFFMLYWADFLNRLCHQKFIPHTTVQEISEEFYKNSLKSQEIRERKLRQSLMEVENLSGEEINKICKDVFEEDFFIKAQQQLNTQYKRQKFVQDKMKYVPPVEIILNKSEVEKGVMKDCIHYIPVDATLKNLLEDKSAVKMFENEKKRPPKDTQIISDILDGSLVKSNDFFKENKDALALIFYSDGLEIKNPLGAARGTYKVVQVFYTLANIPKNQRSQVDRIQLAMIFKEKLLKKYSFKTIYKRLVEDLKKLEDGINVDTPEPSIVKAGLLIHPADNLEAHSLGGFSGSFSSKSICRFCHIQYTDLEDNIHSYDGEGAHDKWTVEDYENGIRSLEEEEDDNDDIEILENLSQDEDELDEDDETENDDGESEADNDDDDDVVSNKWGLKRQCPLNILKAFHCVKSLPPDFMHDILEGIVH